MPARVLVSTFVGIMLLFGVAVCAQPPADVVNDPLPKGAVVRYGITRPILRQSPGVGLIPPKYTNFVAPTMDGGIRRYDLGTGRPLDNKGIVTAGQAIVSADGKRAAVALPGSIHILEVATGNEILAVKPPVGVLIVGAAGVSLSADGKILAFGGKGLDNRGAVVVLDVDQNEVLAECVTDQRPPVHVTLSRDGKILASYGPPAAAPTIDAKPKTKLLEPPDNRRTAQVWEVASGRELFKARVTGMGGNVVAAAFSPDADLLAVSVGDGPVDLFDVKTGKLLHTLLGRKSQGVRLAISPDGKTVASVGTDYRIQRWRSDGKPIDVTDAPAGLLVAPITALEFADNERVIASQTAAQFAYAWDAPLGRLLSPNMDHQAGIRTVAFPIGGKDLFTSGNEGKVFRWDYANGALGEEIAFRPARIPGQPMIRPSVNLSSDGSRATWARPPVAEIFDVSTGDNLYVLPPPSAPPAVVNVVMSQDGLRVAMLCPQAGGKRTGMCVVWDLITEKKVAEVEVPNVNSGSPGVVFSPDGNRLVIAAFSNSPQGFPVLTFVGHDLKTGKKLATVEDPAAAGKIHAAIADDTTLIATSDNGRMWSVDYVNGQIGEDFETLIVKGEAPVHGPIAISPDGKRFATGIVGTSFTTYGVRVYDVATKKALQTFLGHAGPITALHFTPDGQRLASGAEDTSVILWDVTKQAKVK